MASEREQAMANRNEQARKLMQGWNRNVQFQIDKVAPFYVQIREGSATVSSGVCENPNPVMKASEVSFRRMLRGEIQFEEAFIRKQIEAIGSVRRRSTLQAHHRDCSGKACPFDFRLQVCLRQVYLTSRMRDEFRS